MKYLCVLGDGMSDLPLADRANKTPLELADASNFSKLASKGVEGLSLNVPSGFKPGSDVANMAAMGINPNLYYTGRSPLEAVSLGIEMATNDVSFRCNFVSLSDTNDWKTAKMLDYSAGEISTEEAQQLIEYLQSELNLSTRKLYAGISYRHCMIWSDAPLSMDLTPPHDIYMKDISTYLPKGEGADILLDIMDQSFKLLSQHEINKKRIAEGKNPASILWPWGQGTAPAYPSLEEEWGLSSAVISAVDLVRGIGMVYGMDVIKVEGATGTLESNFKGKAEAAIEAFKNGADFVYVHLEAPDECGHQGDTDGKIKAIELVDHEILQPCWQYLAKNEEETDEAYRIYVLPDHPTPISLRTHTSDPVPYIIYDSRKDEGASSIYSEREAKKRNPKVAVGHELFKHFISPDKYPLSGTYM